MRISWHGLAVLLASFACQGGIVAQKDPGPALLVELAGAGLSEDLPVLIPEKEEGASAPQEAVISVRSLIPPNIIRRSPPKPRPPADMTAQWMFGMGLLLFWVSWLLAVWDRSSKMYTRPLLGGEDPPRPEPPHIIYSLTRTR
ncbi:MAG: hypothetical protein HXY18_02645 [Bryobacteraceae bacterium]|nr:hypothetical protein [Bryobacteraceae bacterium]